ncbi:hypothetical protein OG585_42955 [Streptomyces sp. NBC_01340]|nr:MULTISPECIES: hypothetical protein [unclassified Streptomyces]MCX4459493.1 hypothetical protein [Streptomyces sp. NBC_01719]MCX4498851.1 hypothetical protein [Streptomyces sp. NBC_01728]WSI43311.1 hypothetical protein OG585_42955 [Streptomyces sp. NBC_01340]
MTRAARWWWPRPLLAELGAVVPGRGFYLQMNQMDELDTAVRAAAV